MKEEYVTFSQAVKLKELGFDWKCLYHYSNRGTIFSNSKGNSDGWGVYVEELEYSYNKTNRGCIDAPTLSQAQAWLREDKGIFVGVTYDNNMSNYNPYGFRVQIPMCNDRSALGFHEYNQALSAGIDKALELLTVKSTDK